MTTLLKPKARQSSLIALTLLTLSITAPRADSATTLSATARADIVELSMSDPARWVMDTVHLGTKQVKITYDAADQAAVMTPTWSLSDRESSDVGVRNIENGRLQLYQLVDAKDCSQSVSSFEISMPQEYIAEGKLELVFALQAGAKGDYLFNGRTFTMAEFVGNGGQYKKLTVSAPDYHEPLEKLRAIERVSFIFERKGSTISAPIKIRHVAIDLNTAKIIPPAKVVRVKNPKSLYEFTYTTQANIDGLTARVSAESMDITRRVNDAKDGVALIPQWKPGQIPAGHSGSVTLVQPLGAINDFQRFEAEYVLNIPKAYFDEGKLDLWIFIQAGEPGYHRWSGTPRPLTAFADKAGQDVVLTVTQEDFRQGKQRNQIELMGLQLNRNGSTVTEPIMLKRITIKLPVDDQARKATSAAPAPTTAAAVTAPSAAFVWKGDCSSEATFVGSQHPTIPGHYEYLPDPKEPVRGLIFAGHLTPEFTTTDPEKFHLHPDIYFDRFIPGSITVSFDVKVDDLAPSELGPYGNNAWLNLVTLFDETTVAGGKSFHPSAMVNLVGTPGTYRLQAYSIDAAGAGMFYEKIESGPVFPPGKWVTVRLEVDVKTKQVHVYQDKALASTGPYQGEPGLAGAHMGLYANRKMTRATVFNDDITITVGE